MPELTRPGMDESSWIEGIVSEFRTHNRAWSVQGAFFPAGDIYDVSYWGPDKGLLALCLEIRAISWKMTELRDKIGKPPDSLPGSNPEALIEWDTFEDRRRKYQEFFDMAEPLYDERLRGLAYAQAHTLRGLAAKARLIEREILGYGPADQTALGRTLRSLFRDIDMIVGVEE